jgi:hypothetical protein
MDFDATIRESCVNFACVPEEGESNKQRLPFPLPHPVIRQMISDVFGLLQLV